MKAIMVRYKVKADRISENVKYIESVFEELERSQPAGFRYASFKLEDGQSFVHIVVESGDDGPALSDFASFKAFTENIADRCEQPPLATVLSEVGSYRFSAPSSSE